jgi:glyoxylase-like metal-dependent hydrolase (beta-lactamase superfamily II)
MKISSHALPTVATALALLTGACSSSSDGAAADASSGEPPLTLEVYTSNDYGYATTSTIVYGETDAVLIDPQFLASDARKVAEMIRASGKNLATVYTTHAHPDHFLGVAVIKEEFPNARYVALPEVATRIETAWPARRNFWYPTYGDELPSAEPILPDALPSPQLTLEGETMEITGEVMGDGPGNSFVWIPSLRAVVAGDVVFYDRHLGVPADPAPWLETLDRIDALEPEILVAGHKSPNAPDDPRATQWMREYIADFNAFKAESTSAAELKAKMLAKYPTVAMPGRLDQAVEAAFAPAQ